MKRIFFTKSAKLLVAAFICFTPKSLWAVTEVNVETAGTQTIQRYGARYRKITSVMTSLAVRLLTLCQVLSTSEMERSLC